MTAWNGFIKPALSGIMTGLQAVGTAASWLWSNVLSPTFSAIATGAKVLVAVVAVLVVAPIVIAFRTLAAIGSWLWTSALQPAFNGIAAGAMWLWNNALSPAFHGIATVVGWFWAGVNVIFGYVKAGLRAVGSVGMWLYRNALQPAFRGALTVVGWFWTGVSVIFGYVKAGLRAVGSVGSWLYKSAIKPAFDGISSAASFLWSKGLKPAFDAAKHGVKLVGDAFGTAKDAIGKAFGKIEDLTKKPINFVIKWVYTNGIKAVWDKVAGFVGLGKLPAAPKLLAAGGTVGDGWGPATPMRVNRPTAIVGEGRPQYPEYVIPTDPRYRQRALALHAAAGTQLLAGGGVLGTLGDAAGWLGDKAKKVGGAIMDGVDFLAHPGKMWDAATKFIRDKIAKIGQSGFARMIGKIPLKALTSLKDKIVNAATSAFGGGDSGDIGGSGVKRWSSVVLQALKMVGQPASLLPVVLRRMNQESGGNPKAINNWDINAKNGDPSKGLMQVIGSTFAAYAGKLRGRGIYDPLANIYASMRYAMSRYGSLAKAYNRPGGYAKGGRPGRGELAWVGEQGPELIRFGGDTEVFDNRTSLRMAAGLGALRGFAKGTSGAKAAASARKQVPGDLSSFTKSLTGSASDIAKAAKSLAEDLRKTGRAGRALADQVGKTSSKLQSLAKQRDSVASKLETARQAASDQQKSAQDYMSLSSVGEVSSVGDLISGMQQRQGSLKGFESLIKTAQKKGVSQSLIQQLVAAGPDSNLASLVAGANAGDVKRLNALSKSGAKLSTSYGNYMADAMYDSGKQAGRGFLTGLKAQEKELQKQMKKLGDALVDSIEKRLKIHSPSRETHRVGAMVGAGLVGGMAASLPQIDRAAVDMAAAAVPPVMPVAMAAQAQPAGGLRDGQRLAIVLADGTQLDAYVDTRVDAGLADVRRRSRAGSKRG
jgi:SLT domain-containing protein